MGWREAVEGALGVTVLRAEPVGGGCIAHASRVETSGGAVFVKRGTGDVARALIAEAAGLRELSAAGTSLVVPEPLALIEAPEAVLVLPWIETGRPDAAAWNRFGIGMAELHSHAVQRFGLKEDNYIGASEQENGWMADWPEFFLKRRILPQVALARSIGRWPARLDGALERAVDRIARILPDLARGRLLHGDLWSGNVMFSQHGRPVLIDPAVYFGDPEADVAMTRLFGGFDARWLAAYDDAAGGPPPNREERHLAYNLYHLLNHLNLFGGGYQGSVEASLREIGGR
ncbi:MAG: fructosamine kinase family protein [Rhodothermales bacterium]|nr:fructosamine kinase family protein [Rhodothermales bacterium]MBO6779732.1 fructosamine kinase family protein [Rhodothermales bacterium]